MLTCEEDMNRLWAYRCIMRPPVPGAIPKDGLSYIDDHEGYTLSGHHYWGTALYTRELTAEETDHYDLIYAPFAVLD